MARRPLRARHQTNRLLPHLRFSWKRLLYTILPLIFIFISWIALGLRSYNLALGHEQNYSKEIDRLDSLESQWQWVPNLMTHSPKPPPYNERLNPLIYDVVQLYSWGYLSQLGLNEDNTAKYPFEQTWIYVGGTPKKPPTILSKLSPFSPPNGSCADDAYICQSFNDGFNQLMEHFHTDQGRYGRRYGAHLAFADCDVSPLLCDELNIDPVMLLHMETKHPCAMGIAFEFNCTVKWSLVKLPLKKMPFTPSMVMKEGHSAVPMFPSAFEQLASLVSWKGSVDGIELEKYEVVEFIPEGDIF